jgi:hypothetical protein
VWKDPDEMRERLSNRNWLLAQGYLRMKAKANEKEAARLQRRATRSR